MGDTAKQHDNSSMLLDQIIVGVAHELNNPNTFVRLNATNLKKLFMLLGPCLDQHSQEHPDERFGPYSLPELRSKINQMCEGILQASLRIIAIADKLKQCTADAVTQHTAVDVVQVFQNVLGMLRFLLDRYATLEVHIAPDARYEIMGHQLQLEQAFAVLLTNACDAIKERYQDDEAKPGRLSLRVEADASHCVIQIQDNGTGMSQELQQKIFVPYFTTKPQGVGDGLGLPICQAIITRHGGTITVDSTEGHGTLFTLTLPMTQGGSHG